MADLGLDALEDWSAHIPRHMMQPCYKDVLPLLDGYLKSSTSAGTYMQKIASLKEEENNFFIKMCTCHTFYLYCALSVFGTIQLTLHSKMYFFLKLGFTCFCCTISNCCYFICYFSVICPLFT